MYIMKNTHGVFRIARLAIAKNSDSLFSKVFLILLCRTKKPLKNNNDLRQSESLFSKVFLGLLCRTKKALEKSKDLRKK